MYFFIPAGYARQRFLHGGSIKISWRNSSAFDTGQTPHRTLNLIISSPCNLTADACQKYVIQGLKSKLIDYIYDILTLTVGIIQKANGIKNPWFCELLH
jgi:hypothetical protein